MTRDSEFLDLESLAPVIEQLNGQIEGVYFYNYGETFLNKEADGMLLYFRSTFPDAEISKNTNGIPLSNARRAAKVVEATPTSITFTISGVTQDAYEKYHVGGKLSQALGGLKNVCDEKFFKIKNGQNLFGVISFSIGMIRTLKLTMPSKWLQSSA